MPAPLETRILTALRDLRDAIEVLVLFGSRAGGRPRADSDLDVALLAREAAPERDRLPAEVAAALSDVVPYTRVDVVALDRAPELLRQRIMERGQVLLGASSPRWKQLRVQTMREHADREWCRGLLREAQRKRLQEGRPSGRSGRALRSLERAGAVPRGAETVR
jgi:predicted nucleotidyltransferase